MAFFSPFKRKTEPGLLATRLTGGELSYAHVRRLGEDRPVVALCGARLLSGDDEALARWARELGANRYHCSTLLNSGEYRLLGVDAPPVPDAEIKNAVRWKIKDMVDFRVEDAAVDVLAIPGDTDGASRQKRLLAVAARADTARKCMARWRRAKVPLEIIDIPELAQRNVAALLEEEGRGLALLSFAESCGLLTFTHEGELCSARQIDVSWPQLQRADQEQRTRLFERIGLELQRSLDHFDRQFQALPVSRLVLAPLAEDIGLHAYLADNLYLPVMALDLREILSFERLALDSLTQVVQSACFLALGAALRLEEEGA
jgi:MSHA biogenesis protein MshI